MGKAKNAALILLAALLIAACALLPVAIAAYHDSTALGQPRFEEVQTVNLDIREAESMPVLHRLAMMARLDQLIEIPESMASMTQEDAEERALSVLQSYVDAGLVEPYEPEFYDVHCVLSQVVSEPSMTQILWILTLVAPPDVPYACMGLAITDDSGQVLAINYAADQPVYGEDQERRLPVFADLFFGGLGMTDYGDFITNDLKKLDSTQKYEAIRYRFGDEIYGQINVDLYVNEFGFYMESTNLAGGSR